MSSSGHCEDDDWRPYSHKHRDLRAVFEQSRQALEIPEKKLLRALVYHAVLDMQKVYGETAAQAHGGLLTALRMCGASAGSRRYCA